MTKSRWANWSRGIRTEEKKSLSSFLKEAPISPAGATDSGNPTGTGLQTPAEKAASQGLISDGHGGYTDQDGNTVARTVNGELVYYDPRGSGGVVADGADGPQIVNAQPSWRNPVTGMMIVPPAQAESPEEIAAIPDATPAKLPAGMAALMNKKSKQMYKDDFLKRQLEKLMPTPEEEEVGVEIDAGGFAEELEEPNKPLDNYRAFAKRAEPRAKGKAGDAKRAAHHANLSGDNDPAVDPENVKDQERQVKVSGDDPAIERALAKTQPDGVSAGLEKQRARRAQALDPKNIEVAKSPVERQEDGTLLSIYHALQKGAKTGAGANLDLFQQLANNNPAMTTDKSSLDKKWYENHLGQAAAMKEYMGLGEDEIDEDWMYERYGEGDSNYIPKEQQHNTMRDIWDGFTDDQRAVYGKSKDSWNPADISLIRGSKREEIMNTISRLQAQFADSNPELGPAVINTYLKDLAQNGAFLPISLKQGDVEKGVAPQIGAFNMNQDEIFYDENGEPRLIEGGFMDGQSPRTEMGISPDKEGNLGFGTHSLMMDPRFKIGNKEKKFRIENKVGSMISDPNEIAELIDKEDGGYSRANARGGGVPAPVMERLITQFGGSNFGERMGMGNDGFTEDDMKHYAEEYKQLKDDADGEFGFGAGLNWDGEEVEPEEYFKRALTMANTGGHGEKKHNEKYKKGVRTKLRQMKIMRAVQNAKKQGKLGELLAQMYYGAGKVNVDNQNKLGPFLKIQ